MGIHHHEKIPPHLGKILDIFCSKYVRMQNLRCRLDVRPPFFSLLPTRVVSRRPKQNNGKMMSISALSICRQIKYIDWKGWKTNNTFPETNSSHLKRDYFTRKYIFQPSIFRCYVSFREGKTICYPSTVLKSKKGHSLWFFVEVRS